MAPMSDAGPNGVIVITVRQVMDGRPVVVGPETSCGEGRRLMAEHGFRHLPVLSEGRLVGIVSDRDLRSAEARADTAAARVMTPDPVAVTPDTRVEHAARVMLERRFGALPVTERGALVGIVTSTDLLRAFVRVIETATDERIAVDFAAGR
jgi:acetoin utilization protein AcuB